MRTFAQKQDQASADRLTRSHHQFVHRHAASPPVWLQPKLTVSAAGDIYEQEADRVAAQVMRAHEAQPRRACACGGGCPRCRAEGPGEKSRFLDTQRSPAGDDAQAVAPPAVDEVLRSPGQPMDAATRAFFEPRLGYDFSRVRVHTDARAAESARAISARAYTAGRSIVFGPGEYAPHTTEGRRLLAHELAHVVQQGQHAGTFATSAAPSALPGLSHVYASSARVQRQAASDEQMTTCKHCPEQCLWIVTAYLQTQLGYMPVMTPNVRSRICLSEPQSPDEWICEMTLDLGVGDQKRDQFKQYKVRVELSKKIARVSSLDSKWPACSFEVECNEKNKHDVNIVALLDCDQ